MDLAWDVDREGNVSLVRCRVRNDDAVPRRVRIESRLDAPVLPPRRGGIPETGWDESGVTLRLDPGETAGVRLCGQRPAGRSTGRSDRGGGGRPDGAVGRDEPERGS